MSKDKQQTYITKGVSLETAQKRAQSVYDKIVKPQIDEDRKITVKQKRIDLIKNQKVYTNCQSPY